jgi:hypothetical protein
VNKAVLAVLLPFLLVAGGATAIYWWDRGAPPGFRPEAVPVTSDEITLEHRGVRLSGTAHYAVRVREVSADGAPARHIFPVFPKGDLTGKEIRVLVRTRRAPDELVGFEDLVVEGLARPPAGQVPPEARDALAQSGYHFADRWVLVDAWDDPAP